VERGLAQAPERAAGSRPEDAVLADQRAVEVARERLDRAREVGRKPQLFFVRNATSASTWSFGSEAKLGMTGW
jgi:hypothetical protein